MSKPGLHPLPMDARTMPSGRSLRLPETAVHQGCEYAPERRLMAAVLLQAVQDYELLRKWTRSPRSTERSVGHGVWLSRRAYRRLQRYFFRDETPAHLYSAASICEHLDLPLENLRTRLRDGSSNSEEASDLKCPRCNASEAELELVRDRAGRTTAHCLVCNAETEIEE